VLQHQGRLQVLVLVRPVTNRIAILLWGGGWRGQRPPSTTGRGSRLHGSHHMWLPPFSHLLGTHTFFPPGLRASYFFSS
jgi:hypothetical protein